MSDKLLVFAPRFDTATEYSYAWAEDFINKIKDDPSVDYESLLGSSATRDNFNSKMPYKDVLVFFDHGNKNCLFAQNAKRLIYRGNIGCLAGKKAFTMACLSALELGALAYHTGCTEYWGAVESIGFTLVDADLFGEVFVDGAYERYIEEKPITEVYDNMINHFDAQKEKTDNPWTKIWLEKDKDMWRCWYCDNPPEKPRDLNLWEKLIELIMEILEAIGVCSPKPEFEMT